MTTPRIDVDTARAHLAGPHALLVCAYDSPEKCRANQLEGAIDLHQLEALESALPPDEEIIFYCG